MITKLSKKIVSFFVQNEVILKEDREVYEYGMQLLLSTLFNGIIALTLAIITKTLWQSVCYLTTFILFRMCAGGFHARTHGGCSSIFVVVFCIFLSYIKYAPIEIYLITTVGTTIFSIVMIFLFAPLEHKNKPLSDSDKKRLRRNSIIYIIILTIVLVFSFRVKLEMLMVCLALGMFTASASILAAIFENKIKSNMVSDNLRKEANTNEEV